MERECGSRELTHARWWRRPFSGKPIQTERTHRRISSRKAGWACVRACGHGLFVCAGCWVRLSVRWKCRFCFCLLLFLDSRHKYMFGFIYLLIFQQPHPFIFILLSYECYFNILLCHNLLPFCFFFVGFI